MRKKPKFGEFQYGDDWYNGIHEPLVTKEVWDKVQKQLLTPPKKWHKKKFPFKTLCICGSCGGGVTAEEKYKKLKYGIQNTFIITVPDLLIMTVMNHTLLKKI